MASYPRFESTVPVLPDPPPSALVWVVDESTQSRVLIKAAPDSPVVVQLAVPFGASGGIPLMCWWPGRGPANGCCLGLAVP